jgi:hypothetical protein
MSATAHKFATYEDLFDLPEHYRGRDHSRSTHHASPARVQNMPPLASA